MAFRVVKWMLCRARCSKLGFLWDPRDFQGSFDPCFNCGLPSRVPRRSRLRLLVSLTWCLIFSTSSFPLWPSVHPRWFLSIPVADNSKRIAPFAGNTGLVAFYLMNTTSPTCNVTLWLYHNVTLSRKWVDLIGNAGAMCDFARENTKIINECHKKPCVFPNISLRKVLSILANLWQEGTKAVHTLCYLNKPHWNLTAERMFVEMKGPVANSRGSFTISGIFRQSNVIFTEGKKKGRWR